jgi:hypothetical protein
LNVLGGILILLDILGYFGDFVGYIGHFRALGEYSSQFLSLGVY